MRTFEAVGGLIGREPLETTNTLSWGACCYTVDLLPHRARIGINVNIGQLPAYFQLSSRLFIGTGHDAAAHYIQVTTPSALTTASALALP